MAIDIEQIGISVDTTGVERGRDALGRLTTSAHGAADAADKTSNSFSALSSAVNTAKSILAAYLSLQTVKVFVETADAVSLMDARLKLATKSTAEFVEAQRVVYKIAQQNSLGLQETATLFTKMSDPVRNLGGGIRETEGIVDAFAKTLKISGATTQEAAAATLQFAQAMGSGKLQGDEFRSMSETSPRFMKAMAEGMGVPTAKLKEMGSEGKLTADVVGNALLKSLGKLSSEARTLPDTVGNAFTRVKNDVVTAIGVINEKAKLTLGIADVVEVARALIPTIRDELSGAFEAVGIWIDSNKAAIGDIWGTTKGLVGDIWELAKGAGSVLGFLLQWEVQSGAINTLLQSMRLIIAGVSDGVEIIGAAFAGVGSDIMNFVTLPLSGIANMVALIVGSVDSDLAGKIDAMNQRMIAFSNAGGAYAESVAQKFRDSDSAVSRLGKSLETAKTATGEAAKAAEDAASSFAKLKSANGPDKDAIAKANKELEKQGDLLNELSGYTKSYNNEVAELVKLHKSKVLNDAAYEKALNDLIQKQPFMIALNKESAAALKEVAKAQEDARKQAAQYYDGIAKDLEALEATNQKLRDQVQEIGLTTEALDTLTLARLDATIAQEEEILTMASAHEASLGEILLMEKRIRLLKEQRALTSQGQEATAAVKSGEETRRESQRISDQLNQSITDGIFRGFENGKGFAENFASVVESTFKTMILRPTVEATVKGGVGFAQNAVLGATGAKDLNSLLGFSSIAELGGSFGSGFSASMAGGSIADIALLHGGATGVGTTATGAAAGAGAAVAAAMPYIAAAIVLYGAMGGFKGEYVKGAGSSNVALDSAGNVSSRNQFSASFDFQTAAADAIVDGIKQSYVMAAKQLGITDLAASFGYGSNNSDGGKFGITAVAGGASRYNVTDVKTSDAALSLEASRAVFAALQGSNLPAYLAQVFNGLTASTATEAQIQSTLQFATGLKTLRDSLTETREPLQILRDNVANGFKSLGTTADTFKRDFVAAIDAGIGADAVTQWTALGSAMQELDRQIGTTSETARLAAKTLADQETAQANWQQKVDLASGKVTQDQLDMASALVGANAPTQALIAEFYRLKTSAAEAATALADAEDAKALLEQTNLTNAQARQSLQDTYRVPLTASQGFDQIAQAGFQVDRQAFQSMSPSEINQFMAEFVRTVSDPALVSSLIDLGPAIAAISAESANAAQLALDTRRTALETYRDEQRAYATAQSTYTASVNSLAKVSGALSEARVQGALSGLSEFGKYFAKTDIARGLLTTFDGSMDSLNNLASTSVSMYQEQLALVQQIRSAASSVSDSFAQSIRTIQLDMLDSPEKKYDFFDKEAAKYRDILATLTDPAAISMYAGKLQNSITSGYGLLDPGQKSATGQDFIALLDAGDRLAQERFAAAQVQVQSGYDSLAGKIEQAITKAVGEAMTKASDDLSAAANKMQDAADAIPSEINVRITTDVAATSELVSVP